MVKLLVVLFVREPKDQRREVTRSHALTQLRLDRSHAQTKRSRGSVWGKPKGRHTPPILRDWEGGRQATIPLQSRGVRPHICYMEMVLESSDCGKPLVA